MTIKDFFSFRQNRFFWANILAMAVVVVGLLFGVLKGLDIYTRHGEAVIVPDVKGMGVEEARKCSVTAAWSASFRIPVMSRLFLPAASSNIIRQLDKR